MARQRRKNRIGILKYFVRLAEAEDQWDPLLRRERGLSISETDTDASKTSWATELRDAVGWNEQLQARLLHKNRSQATRMWDIVLKERELAGKEKEDRKQRYLVETEHNGGDGSAP